MTTEELAREERELDYLADRFEDIDTDREWQDNEDFRRGGYE